MLHIPPSERLCYSLLSEHDADLLLDIDQDEEVMRFINGGHKSTIEDIRQFILPRMARYYNPPKGWGIWQVRRLEDQQYLGWVLIRPMDFLSDAPAAAELEIGWRFKRCFWGQGYASEAAQAVSDTVLAADPAVRYLSAIAMPDNHASVGVMKKLGLVFERRGSHRDARGQDVDVVFYRKVLQP
ncbi:GNAT family N-acetyltransferase [Chromatiaceae bacterium AAb-1]|jgi:RimJ/RimL family protein N-acetyltransferase|nr:GNAT family N-acetyltransferase [Chromatiaceae bacterium AAb-1]